MSHQKDTLTNSSHEQCRLLNKHMKADKYSLRPRGTVRRLQQERFREGVTTKDSKRSKSRPPPLSKYRRKTANARERHRMQEINEAFETLRRILPDFCTSHNATSTTKITTLRLAVSYIRSLSHILQDGNTSNLSLFSDLHFGEDSLHRLQSNSMVEGSNFQISQTSEMSFNPVSFSPSTCSPLSGSLGSGSDISDILSDDSFEESFDLFDNIHVLSELDPLTLLLTEETTLAPT